MSYRARLGLDDQAFTQHPAVPWTLAHDTGMADRHHVLFTPLHYEPKYAYPLLIWLHDSGADEEQLLEILPQLSLRNYVAIAPRGIASAEAGPRHWGWPGTPGAAASADACVGACIQEAQQRRHIAARRIFLAGMGAGGTMALRLALSNPQRFAGAISLEGPLPQGHAPLMRVDEARKLPLWIAHIRDSGCYQVDQLCVDLRLLHTAGMQLTLRQYTGAPNLLPQMLHDLNLWLMERVTEGNSISSAPA